MSRKGLKAKTDILKKENAEKKAKQKRLIIICVCVLTALVIAGISLYFFTGQKSTETFGLNGQTVQLFADGKFSASLAHSVQKSGTYTKRTENGGIVVSFNINGKIENGWIINNALYLPDEWDDNHGHGNVFPRTK